MRWPVFGRLGSITNVNRQVASLRLPAQLQGVGFASIGGEVPINMIGEAAGVSVQKQEVGSVGVEIRMNVVLLCHRRSLSVVKKPDERMRRRQGG